MPKAKILSLYVKKLYFYLVVSNNLRTFATYF